MKTTLLDILDAISSHDLTSQLPILASHNTIHIELPQLPVTLNITLNHDFAWFILLDDDTLTELATLRTPPIPQALPPLLRALYDNAQHLMTSQPHHSPRQDLHHLQPH